MPLAYQHLLGVPFVDGREDCFWLMREFFQDNFGLEIPNFARPTGWWDHGANLFMDHYAELGFAPVNLHPRLWTPGMVLLMAINSKVANHGAILLPNSQILHTLPGGLSRVESYNRPLYRDTTVAVLQHPRVVYDAAADSAVVDVLELLAPNVRRKLEEARGV